MILHIADEFATTELKPEFDNPGRPPRPPGCGHHRSGIDSRRLVDSRRPSLLARDSLSRRRQRGDRNHHHPHPPIRIPSGHAPPNRRRREFPDHHPCAECPAGGHHGTRPGLGSRPRETLRHHSPVSLVHRPGVFQRTCGPAPDPHPPAPRCPQAHPISATPSPPPALPWNSSIPISSCCPSARTWTPRWKPTCAPAFTNCRIEVLRQPPVEGIPGMVPGTGDRRHARHPPIPTLDQSHLCILRDEKWALQDFLPTPKEVVEIYPSRSEMRLLRMLRLARVSLVRASPSCVSPISPSAWSIWSAARNGPSIPARPMSIKTRLAKLISERQKTEHWNNLLEDRSKAWTAMESLARMFPENGGMLVKNYAHIRQAGHRTRPGQGGFRQGMENHRLRPRRGPRNPQHPQHPRRNLRPLRRNRPRHRQCRLQPRIPATAASPSTSAPRKTTPSNPSPLEETSAADESTYPFTFDLTITQRFEATDPMAINVPKASGQSDNIQVILMHLYRQSIIIFGIVLPVAGRGGGRRRRVHAEIQNGRLVRQQTEDLQNLRTKPPVARLEIETQVTRQRPHLDRWNEQLSQETASAVATNLRKICRTTSQPRKSSKPPSSARVLTADSAPSPPRSHPNSASPSAAPSAPCNARSSNWKPACPTPTPGTPDRLPTPTNPHSSTSKSPTPHGKINRSGVPTANAAAATRMKRPDSSQPRIPAIRGHSRDPRPQVPLHGVLRAGASCIPLALLGRPIRSPCHRQRPPQGPANARRQNHHPHPERCPTGQHHPVPLCR